MVDMGYTHIYAMSVCTGKTLFPYQSVNKPDLNVIGICGYKYTSWFTLLGLREKYAECSVSCASKIMCATMPLPSWCVQDHYYFYYL